MENKYPLIGERIKELRLKYNLTQEELAEKSDISQGFLGRIERGIGFPSLETIINIANALSVGIDRLIFDYIDKDNVIDDDFIIMALSKMTPTKILRIIGEVSKAK